MVFRKLGSDGVFYRLVVRPVSEASYGMYLMHMFVLMPVSAVLILRMSTPLAIVATALVSYAASAFVAIVVRKIPLVGKWLC